MIDFGPPPKLAKPALILPKPAEIIRPGDPRFVVPGMFVATGLSGFGAGGGPAGYTALNSGSFNGTSARLTRTMGSPTDNKKWALSVFIKRSATGITDVFFGATSGTGFNFRFATDDTIVHSFAGSDVYRTSTTFGATPFHLLIHFDSDNATQADRIILYKDGVRCSTSTASVGSGQTSHVNSSGVSTRIGEMVYNGNSDDWFGGNMAEVAFIDGNLPAASVFYDAGSPKDLSTGVTWGANGAWLKFQDSGALGTDSSGNGNTWTNTNVTQSSSVPPAWA